MKIRRRKRKVNKGIKHTKEERGEGERRRKEAEEQKKEKKENPTKL